MTPLRALVGLTAGGLAGLLLAACGSDDPPLASREFCEATARFEDAVERSGLDSTDPQERARAQLPALEAVATVAPEEVADDVDTMLDGYRRALDGEDISDDEDRYVDAARRVERFFIDRCGPLDEQPGRSGV